MVDIDARIAYRTVDPLKTVLAVHDIDGSLAARAVDILGALVAESTGEDVRFRRKALAERLGDRLDDEVEEWGVAVTDVSLTQSRGRLALHRRDLRVPARRVSALLRIAMHSGFGLVVASRGGARRVGRRASVSG